MSRSRLTLSSQLRIWADNSSSLSRCSSAWRSCHWHRAFNKWQRDWTPRTGPRWRAVHISWRVPVAMSAQVASTIAAITFRMASHRMTIRRWSTIILCSSSHALRSSDSRERILPTEIVNIFSFKKDPCFNSWNLSIFLFKQTDLVFITHVIRILNRKRRSLIHRKWKCSNGLYSRWLQASKASGRW